jgi:hypothetical protein
MRKKDKFAYTCSEIFKTEFWISLRERL